MIALIRKYIEILENTN